MDAIKYSAHSIETQRMLDRAQAVAGREYRMLRALMLVGDQAELDEAKARFFAALPAEITEGSGFKDVCDAMRVEAERMAERDLFMENPTLAV
ncbi:MAG: hypothetical protein K2Q12_11550 [Rickettsiales bacterium]|nr:hypothetical protein [Rickettsiales bacterium]